MEDAVEDIQREQRLVGFRGAREERADGEVVRTCLRRHVFLARRAVNRHSDDRLGAEDEPCDARRWIVPTDVHAVRIEASRELGIVVHEEGHVVGCAQPSEPAACLRPFRLRVRTLVPHLDDGHTAFECRFDDRHEPLDGPFRRCHEVHATERPVPPRRTRQAISPARARLNATQNGSRSAGSNGRPRSMHRWPAFVNAPMSAARLPIFLRRAVTSSAEPGSTAMRSVPSLMASSGSMPKTSETASTAGSMGTFDRSTLTPRPDACDISQTALRTPPSVASCIAQTPRPRKPTDAAAIASSTVLIDSNSARAARAVSGPSRRSTSSGNVFERIAVASRAAVFVTRRRFPALAMFAVTHPSSGAIAKNVAPPTMG